MRRARRISGCGSLALLLSAAFLAPGTTGAQAAPSVVTATVDWATERVVTRTAATVEVDVMPFLGRADWGGPFNAYYEALENLGAEYGACLASIGLEFILGTVKQF